jgi:hypothetical protein
VIVTILFFAVTALVCGYGLIRGGAPERVAAGIVLSGVAASFASVPIGGHRFRALELDILLIDLAMYAAFQQLAFRADRFWTTWVAGFQLSILLVHLAVALMPYVVPYAYSAAMWIWPLAILACMAAGTWRHVRRVKQWGRDPAWSIG